MLTRSPGALDDIFFGSDYLDGFLIEAVACSSSVAAIAGALAYRAVPGGAPPTPDMAIEEGKRIRARRSSRDTPRRPSRPFDGAVAVR